MSTSESSHSQPAFDSYLDALLSGKLMAPEEFLGDGIPGSEEEREAMRRLHDVLCHGKTRPIAPEFLGSRLPEEQQHLASFRLLRRLGEGGMGVVYLAEQPHLGRLVALKVLGALQSASSTSIERFRREARAVARLQHPGIVRLLEYGEADGVCYIAMDYVPGRSLRDLLREKEGDPIPLRSIMKWGVQLSEALGEAHEQGIVHRDVKPANIMIDARGRARLLDFGLAKSIGEELPALTTSFVGSPRYAAPEQLDASRGDIDARTDVHGLAVTLYECITLKPPFAGESLEELCRMILSDPPESMRRLRPDVPRSLETVVYHGMSKDPDHRYQSATAFGDDLRRILDFRPIHARKPGAVTRLLHWHRRNRAFSHLIQFFVVVLVVLALWLWHQDLERDRQRRDMAQKLVKEAHFLMQNYADQRMPFEQMRWRLRALSSEQEQRVLTAPERKERGELDLAVRRRERERSLLLRDVEDHLSRAAEVFEDVPGLDDVWANLYYQRWLDLRGDRESDLARHYRREALRRSDDPAWRRRLARASPVSIDSQPAGARIYLFRTMEGVRIREVWPKAPWLNKVEDHRMLPVPVGEAIPVLAPGTPGWRIREDSGGLKRGDIIVASRVDGPRASDPALIVRDGHLLRRDLPVDFESDFTGSPLFVSPGSMIGCTPLKNHLLSPGTYLAVVAAPGHEWVRLSFHVDYPEDPYHQHEGVELSVQLWPLGTTPRGFCRVTAEVHDGSTTPSFAIQRYEVSSADYGRFLNALPAQDQDRMVPENSAGTAAWRKSAAGYWQPPPGFERLPVSGITHEAAAAYCRWFKGSNARSGSFALPRRDEWLWSLYGGESRAYSHGSYFRQDWVGSRYAGVAGRVAAGGSFWRDESLYGAFDQNGNLAEFGTDMEGRPLMFGGSFADARAALFHNGSSRRAAEGMRQVWCGFRLVWHPERKQ